MRFCYRYIPSSYTFKKEVREILLWFPFFSHHPWITAEFLFSHAVKSRRSIYASVLVHLHWCGLHTVSGNTSLQHTTTEQRPPWTEVIAEAYSNFLSSSALFFIEKWLCGSIPDTMHCSSTLPNFQNVTELFQTERKRWSVLHVGGWCNDVPRAGFKKSIFLFLWMCIRIQK